MSAQHNQLLQTFLDDLESSQAEELLRQLKGNHTPTKEEILQAMERGGMLMKLEIGVENPTPEQIFSAMLAWMHSPRNSPRTK